MNCRLLLESAGPLPQYHPSFLSALLLAGKRDAAAAVFQRLTLWLAALQQQAEANAVADAGVQPPSPSMHMSALAPDQLAPSFGGECNATVLRSPLAVLPACALPAMPFLMFAWFCPLVLHCAGLSLAELADPDQIRLPALLERSSADAVGASAAPTPAAQRAQQQTQQPAQASHADSGMLDLAAFGMAPAPAAEPALQQQQAAGGHMESGMLDLAAFGMAPPAAA